MLISEVQKWTRKSDSFLLLLVIGGMLIQTYWEWLVMSDSSKAPETGTNEINENMESIAAPKKAGMSSTAKIIGFCR